MPNVTLSNKIAAKPELIWSTLGQFGAMAKWHPMVERTDVSEADGATLRTLHLVGGGQLVERLEQLDEGARRYAYSIVSGPLPVQNYRAEITVKDNGDGTSTVEWSGNFEPAGLNAGPVTKSIEEIYKAGLANVEKMFGLRR